MKGKKIEKVWALFFRFKKFEGKNNGKKLEIFLFLWKGKLKVKADRGSGKKILASRKV